MGYAQPTGSMVSSPMLLTSLRLTVLIGAVLLACPLWAIAASPSETATDFDALPDSSLIYVSDYFSFVGQDDQGHVAFALDNNRGRDGDRYQAEHFLVLHEEGHGWVKLDGNGFFDNREHGLRTIPDSPFFSFDGSPRAGMTITSAINRLTLRIDAIPQRTGNRHQGAVTWMGSAPAVLTWKDRTLQGRVIYEYVMMPNFNRLTRTYWGMWKEFQGLYLSAGGTGDVYLHSQRSERIAPLVGMLAGFAAFNEASLPMRDLNVDILDRDWAFGFYRWPTAWRVTWTGPQGPAVLTLTQTDRRGIGNWVIGGFSMGIVRGEFVYGGATLEIYGLAELIM